MDSSKVTIEWSEDGGKVTKTGTASSGSIGVTAIGYDIGYALQKCGAPVPYLEIAKAIRCLDPDPSGDKGVDLAVQDLIAAARRVRDEWERLDMEDDNAQP